MKPYWEPQRVDELLRSWTPRIGLHVISFTLAGDDLSVHFGKQDGDYHGYVGTNVRAFGEGSTSAGVAGYMLGLAIEKLT